MKIYPTLICPDCGVCTEKKSPNMKRCKPCALAAHGQTGTGLKERICIVCSSNYKPTSASQKVCTVCKHSYTRHQNTEALRKMRLDQGVTPKGSVLNCPECNEDFVYKSGPQHRCPECQRRTEVRKIHEWLASDKDRLKKYTKKASDNYYFGGNRDAALERDNYTCQHCGSKDDLQVHHIDGKGTTTPKEHRNHVLENLLTLCRGCHTRVHSLIRHSS